MQANRIRRRRCGQKDVQRAVMALTISMHPHWCTIPELRREIGCGSVVKEAVGQLIKRGLLERGEAAIRATPPVVYLEKLELP